MRTLIALLCAWLAGSIAWWLGHFAGLIVAVILGAIASAFGWYAGQRWFDENLK